MIIDCDTCAVRGDACGDCVVAVLLGARPELSLDEERAIGVLADAGLVPPLRLVPGEPGEGEQPVTDPTPSVTDDTVPRSTRAV
ncbi:MAG TPA: hypothetical protein VFX15_03535 [Actinomycetes bacterium]|nr:hypothetical protein [Actinomycetes bacterium]